VPPELPVPELLLALPLLAAPEELVLLVPPLLELPTFPLLGGLPELSLPHPAIHKARGRTAALTTMDTRVEAMIVPLDARVALACAFSRNRNMDNEVVRLEVRLASAMGVLNHARKASDRSRRTKIPS
jgi:hypothetical protein